MPLATHVEDQAAALVDRHGLRARQVVVDEIVTAIREQDVPRAKRWDAVGDAVDRLIERRGRA